MKGQMVFEFMGTITILMLIYAIFALYILTHFSMIVPWETQTPMAEHFAQRIAKHINYAYFAGDGYKDSFELPEEIGGRDYVFYYDPVERTVELDVVDLGDIDSYGIAEYLAPNVILINVSAGTNYISNSNGLVMVFGSDVQ